MASSDNSRAVIPPAWLFKFIQLVRRGLMRVESGLLPPTVVVYEKAQGFWISKAIGVACNLNIADLLITGPLKIEEIARLTNTNEQNLYRVMRALAGDGIFKESSGRIFANTALSRGLTDGKDSMKYMIQHQLNDTNWEIIGKLEYSVKTGKCASKEILGTDIFNHLEKNSEKNVMYNKAMSNTSALSSAALLAAYSFKKNSVIVDVGGGDGSLLAMILLKHKQQKGILFDLPHVVETAKERFQKLGLDKRTTVISGDFFKLIPSGGDIYIMKNILHAFDDETCSRILENISNVMHKGEKLLIMEAVIDANNKPAYGKLIDLQMLIGTDGGRERTQKEFESLLNQTGFKLIRVKTTVSPFSVLEAIKL
jgi:hypothetical protein